MKRSVTLAITRVFRIESIKGVLTVGWFVDRADNYCRPVVVTALAVMSTYGLVDMVA